MLQRILWVAVVLGVVAGSANAQDKVMLKWKFEKDKTFFQEMTTTTKQTMKVMGTDVTQDQSQTFYFSWKCTDVKDDKATLIQKIEGVKMSIDIAGTKIAYDSQNPETSTNNPLGDFFKSLVGQEFTVTVDTKTMKVTNLEGRDKFVESLTKVNPQMKPLLDQILSKEALMEMADPTFAAAPGKEVKAAEEIATKTSTLNMGPIGKYENTYKYVYDGKDEKNKALDKISVTTTLKYIPPDEKAAVGLPFKIKSAELAASDAKGIILFNAEKGRVDSSDLSLELKGKLSIEIGGQVTQVELTQKQQTVIKTSDENPIKPKKS